MQAIASPWPVWGLPVLLVVFGLSVLAVIAVWLFAPKSKPLGGITLSLASVTLLALVGICCAVSTPTHADLVAERLHQVYGVTVTEDEVERLNYPTKLDKNAPRELLGNTKITYPNGERHYATLVAMDGELALHAGVIDLLGDELPHVR